MKPLIPRRRREVPELNTSSLPDLIFTVLFFFMIVTHMRDDEPKVRYQVPQGTELSKLHKKSSVIHIYIGQPATAPQQADGQPAYLIQLNGQLAPLDSIPSLIRRERSLMSSEDVNRMTVSIKADRQVPMGIVSDVKQRLQQANALRINYSASEAPQSREPAPTEKQTLQ